MGRRLQLEWHESESELKQRYQSEKHGERRTRLQALWLLRQGKRVADVVEVLGVNYRTVQAWVAWYRQGGLPAVLRRVGGYQARGQPAYLTPRQQRALVTRVALGDFKTVWEVRRWVEARWGIGYTYSGMWELMTRLRLGLKVPRPQAEKASPLAQARWKKGAWEQH
jgi:transposase